MRTRNIFALAALVAMLFQLAFAGTTGKITGVIKDAGSGEPLVGVNVILKGTILGASTDADGYYAILNIPPGVYQVEANYLGYQTTVMSDVLVKVDLNTPLNFQLREEAFELGDVITIVADRPLLQKDATASAAVTTSEQFEDTPLETVQDVIELTAGITGSDRNIHVRGGREGEVAYFVDGVGVMDPLYNTRGADLNSNSVAEVQVITGGFSAEYGDALSAVVNQVTKEGSEQFTGSIRYTTDQLVSELGSNWGEQYRGYPFAERSKLDFGYSRVETSLSGSVPGLRRVRFFVSNEVRLTDDLDPRLYMLPHQEQEYHSTQGKLTWQINNPQIKFIVSGFHTRDQQGNFNTTNRYFLTNYYSNSRFSDQAVFKMNHVLSPTTFYELTGSYFRTERWFAVRQEDPELSDYDKWWEDYDYKRGAYPDISVNEYAPAFTNVLNPYGIPGVFWGEGDARVYERRSTDTYSIKGNLTSQINQVHELRGGFDVRFYDIFFFSNSLNYDPQPFQDNYSDSPFQMAFYVQDKIDFKGIVVRGGLRLDYFDSKSFKYSDPFDQTSEKLYADPKWRLNPRLGIAHPISETAQIFYNYGKFFQVPQLQYFFTGINSDLSRGNQILGDPDLDVEKTTMYEIGYNQLLSENLSLGITAFYKDIRDLVQTRRVPAIPNPYFQQVNIDFANVRGFEVILNKRMSNNIGGYASYSMQVARGVASDATEAYFDYYNNPNRTDPVTGGTRVIPRADFYLDFDQRHTFKFSGKYALPKGGGPSLFSTKPLQNVIVSAVYNLASGLPYSPEDDRGNLIGLRNSARLPWNSSLDLRVSKAFNFKRFSLNLFGVAYNLLDTQNIVNVYPRTGLPETDGITRTSSSISKTSANYVPFRDLNRDGRIDNREAQSTFDEAYASRLNSPFNYGSPRVVRIGIELNY